MILKRKDITKNMLLRTFDKREYRVIEEFKTEQRETVTGKQISIQKIQKAIDLETGKQQQLSMIYYKIRSVHNVKKTKIIAKRKHTNSELKIE